GTAHLLEDLRPGRAARRLRGRACPAYDCEREGAPCFRRQRAGSGGSTRESRRRGGDRAAPAAERGGKGPAGGAAPRRRAGARRPVARQLPLRRGRRGLATLFRPAAARGGHRPPPARLRGARRDPRDDRHAGGERLLRRGAGAYRRHRGSALKLGEVLGSIRRQLGLVHRGTSFRLLFLSTLVSGLGTWMAVIALTVDVFDRTHSAKWVSALLIADFLP